MADKTDKSNTRGVTATQGVPRWAKSLGAETWERVNELLVEGFDTPDIMRELALPSAKLRSLQIHARKYGPRRRLQRFAAFKDALLAGAVDLGPKFMAALGLVASYAVSPDVDPGKQRQACELMNEFTKTLVKLMRTEEREAVPDTAAGTTKTDKANMEQLSDDAIARIKAIYGLDGDGRQ